MLALAVLRRLGRRGREVGRLLPQTLVQQIDPDLGHPERAQKQNNKDLKSRITKISKAEAEQLDRACLIRASATPFPLLLPHGP